MGAAFSLEALLSAARAAGVELWAEGRRLRFRASAAGVPEPLRSNLREHRDALVNELRKVGAREVTRASLAENQRGLWFLQRLAPSSSAYNLAFAARFHGPLDFAALQETLQILVDRHESLRSTYPDAGNGPERWVVRYSDIDLERIDARNRSAEELRGAIAADYRRPFDLAAGPLVRASLYDEADDRSILLVTVHHVAVDGTALFVLQEQLLAIYEALVEGKALPALEGAVYSDFVEWQRDAVANDTAGAKHWRQALTPYPGSLDLPTDRPRPRLPALQGATLARTLSAATVAAIRAAARASGTTEYVVLLSLWFVLLQRLSGKTDITVGTPVLGRPSARFERTVGDFINMLPLRVRGIDEFAFDDLLQDVRSIVLGGLAHQDFPLPRMVERQGGRGDFAQPPFQTTFVLQDFSRFAAAERLLSANEEMPIAGGRLTLSPYLIDQQEGQVELGLEVWPRGGDMLCMWRFDTDLYDESTIAAWADCFEILAGAAAAQPDTRIAHLPLLSPAARAAIVAGAGEERSEYPEAQTVVDLVSAAAAKRPQAVAMRFEGAELSYGELEARSNRLARRLIELGAAPGERVGLGVARGLEMLVAMLAILKTGAAYVPLDPGFPAERLSFMLADSGAKLLVTDAALAGSVFASSDVTMLKVDRDDAEVSRLSDAALPRRASSEDLAYVIYTSGSTGRPKGVEIGHRALTNFLWSMARAPGMQEDDVLVAVTTISFDIAGLELWLPLVVGARIELASRETALDGAALAKLLKASGATVLQATPATWRMLIEAGWQGSGKLKALCGGEALGRDLVQRLLPLCGELWNMYGPTETTIWSAVERIRSAEDITIGRPIANTTLYVLDRHAEPVPRGVIGELWIGGDGVARGYLNRPELTAERFVRNPFHGDRMYRTGDLARQLADGRFECLGRVDNQVKIRGYRIELGEIEAVLGEQPGVTECAVAAVSKDGDARLVAYVVGEVETAACRDYLRGRLPEYMLPAQFVYLPVLPKTPNNKIDRKALPMPEAAAEQRVYEAPRTPTEQLVADIFAEVLGTAPVGRDDGFFELGGHSLLATKLVARLKQKLGTELSVRVVFEASTVSVMSAHIDTLQWMAASAAELGSANEERERITI